MKSPINFVDMDEEEERERIGERRKKRRKKRGGRRKGTPFSQVPESAPDWDCSKTFL